MREGIEARWPHLQVSWLHAQVQGPDAPISISTAMEKAVGLNPDVIICGRGGGSESDLNAFNHEITVRSFYNINIPIVSAVGHETDFCLCDHVADVRAKTPTAAIEMVIPFTYAQRLQELEKLMQQLQTCFSRVLERQRLRLDQCTQLMQLPMRLVFEKQAHILSKLSNRMEQRMKHIISVQTQRLTTKEQAFTSCVRQLFSDYTWRLEHKEKQLDQLSYRNTLKRGFAIITQGDESSRKIVKTVAVMQPGASFYVHFGDGKVLVTVNEDAGSHAGN